MLLQDHLFQSSLRRRTFLKNITLGGGVAVLGPLLAQLDAHAAGDTAALPRRFVFFVEGNGIDAQHLVPKNVVRPTAKPDVTGPLKTDAQVFRDLSLAELELPFCLEPLAPFKNRLAIVQGLSGRVCEGGHSVNFGALGMYGANRGPAGETIDAALAKLLKAPFPHLGLGITHRPGEVVVQNISAWDAGRALPTVCEPTAAHYSLFGSVMPGAREDFDASANVLDYVMQDLKRVSKNLAGPEKEKLDVYEASLAGMRSRQTQIAGLAETLKARAPVVGPKYSSLVETERFASHVEVGTAALIAGLTNVLTLASGCGSSNFEVRFTGLGISLDKHAIGHGQGENGKSGDELARIIRRWHMEQLATIATRLQAIPEGNGTMLDNTAIIYLSDSADAHHARCLEWPLLILGDLGGKLKTRGRYIEYPAYGRPGHRTMACLYSTFLHAAGSQRDTFGMPDRNLDKEFQTGPLSQLLV